MKFINDLGFDIKIQVPPLKPNLPVRWKMLRTQEIIEISDTDINYIESYKRRGLRVLGPSENIELKVLNKPKKNK